MQISTSDSHYCQVGIVLFVLVSTQSLAYCRPAAPLHFVFLQSLDQIFYSSKITNTTV